MGGEELFEASPTPSAFVNDAPSHARDSVLPQSAPLTANASAAAPDTGNSMLSMVGESLLLEWHQPPVLARVVNFVPAQSALEVTPAPCVCMCFLFGATHHLSPACSLCEHVNM